MNYPFDDDTKIDSKYEHGIRLGQYTAVCQRAKGNRGHGQMFDSFQGVRDAIRAGTIEWSSETP